MAVYTDEKAEKEKMVAAVVKKHDKQKMKTESAVLEKVIFEHMILERKVNRPLTLEYQHLPEQQSQWRQNLPDQGQIFAEARRERGERSSGKGEEPGG